MSLRITFQSSHYFIEKFCVLVPYKRTKDYHAFQDEVRRIVCQACADVGEFREEWDHAYLNEPDQTHYGMLTRTDEYDEPIQYAVSASVIRDCTCYQIDCEWCNLVSYTTTYGSLEELLEEFHTILDDQFNSPTELESM